MTNAERAERAARALDIYFLSGYSSEDDRFTAIYDLVCDLGHLSDTFPQDDDGGETNGDYVHRMGAWHYREELAEEAEGD